MKAQMAADRILEEWHKGSDPIKRLAKGEHVQGEAVEAMVTLLAAVAVSLADLPLSTYWAGQVDSMAALAGNMAAGMLDGSPVLASVDEYTYPRQAGAPPRGAGARALRSVHRQALARRRAADRAPTARRVLR